ncbi:MAG: hypothetical protein GEU95_06200 [Rhizobiales bacterium]|nr:hypothetical protein [Hyphomicrobiales bacterium]
MIRFVCSALVAGALLIPVAMSTHVSNQALAQATDQAAEKAEPGKATKKKRAAKSKAATTRKRELTAGQKAARERQRQCGEEWREAKQGGKVQKGMTWPKYWSACNTRLKGKAT